MANSWLSKYFAYIISVSAVNSKDSRDKIVSINLSLSLYAPMQNDDMIMTPIEKGLFRAMCPLMSLWKPTIVMYCCTCTWLLSLVYNHLRITLRAWWLQRVESHLEQQLDQPLSYGWATDDRGHMRNSFLYNCWPIHLIPPENVSVWQLHACKERQIAIEVKAEWQRWQQLHQPLTWTCWPLKIKMASTFECNAIAVLSKLTLFMTYSEYHTHCTYLKNTLLNSLGILILRVKFSKKGATCFHSHQQGSCSNWIWAVVRHIR